MRIRHINLSLILTHRYRLAKELCYLSDWLKIVVMKYCKYILIHHLKLTKNVIKLSILHVTLNTTLVPVAQKKSIVEQLYTLITQTMNISILSYVPFLPLWFLQVLDGRKNRSIIVKPNSIWYLLIMVIASKKKQFHIDIWRWNEC